MKLSIYFGRHLGAQSGKLCAWEPILHRPILRLKICAKFKRTIPKIVHPMAELCAPGAECTVNDRLGKLVCPRVNDDQKIGVDDQKLSPGRPHDYWIFEGLIYENFVFFSYFC